MLPPGPAACLAAIAAAAVAAAAAAAAAAAVVASPARLQSLSSRLPAPVSRSRRLVGGTEADVSTAPWMASLHHRRRHLCCASVIAARWLLTSAQCVHNAPQAMSARVGSSLRGSGGQVCEVESVTPHENYQPWSWDYDVAVVRLATDITFDENKKAVSLADSEPLWGTDLRLWGWGLQARAGAASWRLRTAALKSYDRDPCNAKYNAALTERLLCAGAKDVDACVGDGGAPLVDTSSDQQVGIVLWEHDCAKPRHNETEFRMPYTSVPALHAWIKDKTDV